jgi:hypothetical protein
MIPIIERLDLSEAPVPKSGKLRDLITQPAKNKG